jgi:hypothetical protein
MSACKLLLVTTMIGAALAYDPAWLSDADSTFYTGVDDDSGGYAGNCGYGDLSRTLGLDHVPYGPMFFAGSPVLYRGGAGCGSCYEIECSNSSACTSGPIQVTMTDFCPTLGNERWCSGDHIHFDLSGHAFSKTVNDVGVGHTPLQFRRVECVRNGFLVVQIVGNPWWQEFLMMNVPGSGTYDGLSVKGKGADWIPLARDWGANFLSMVELKGAISLKITDSFSGAETLLMDCVPEDWKTNSVLPWPSFHTGCGS